MNYLKPTLLFLLFANLANGQCPNLNLQHGWDIPFTFPNQCMTAKPDSKGRPYLYIAAKEDGVLIYDISGTPSKVKQFTTANLGGLQTSSVTHVGNYLYAALGNIFSTSQAGLAIIDVSTPSSPVLKGTYKLPGSTGGAGIVCVEGNYAYLGAMGNGLAVLDVSDKSNIKLESQFVPSNYFPNPNNPDPAKYNARGMAVRNHIVYLCHDAGGIRIINVNDKKKPVQTGQYSVPFLNDKPRAYNNIVLNDSLAYVAIDYCGMEILNIADTANIKQVGWWNPWKCGTVVNNWFNSPGHTNEIEYDKNCQLVFMSSGKSEVHVVNVANPAQPDSCGAYGNTTNKEGTWGIGLGGNKIFAAYIFVPTGIPFFSNWSGVKMITWNNNCTTSIPDIADANSISIYPNPAVGKFTLQSSKNLNGEIIQIIDICGRIMLTQSVFGNHEIDVSTLADGPYVVRVGTVSKKLLVY